MDKKVLEFSEKTISEYKSAVNYMAEKKKKLIFANPSERHASIVISTLIKHTEENFYIYDRDLTGDIINLNDELIPNLKKILKDGKSVTFIVENSNIICDELTEILTFKNAKLIQAEDKFKKIVKEKLGANYYFALADKTKFRLESSQNNRKALCSFNNKEYTTTLVDILKESRIIN